MRKTGREIELDIFKMIKGYEPKLSDGEVYIGGTRPFDTSGEDIVISHLSGIDGWGGFDQSGIVIVNIHVPDIPHAESGLLPDISRVRGLERKMLEFIEGHKTGDYRLRTQGTATMIKDNGEHIVSFRVEYRYNIKK